MRLHRKKGKMGKKYYIIARNYEDKVWQYEKQVNTLFFARIFFTYACLRWNIVEMHKMQPDRD